jgi:hypothetical protein
LNTFAIPKKIEMNYFLHHLFRHPAADKNLKLKELIAAVCHLFLKEEKELSHPPLNS